MKEEKIKRVINGKLEQVSSYAEKVNESFGKNDIHDLRVSVKSLRSFLRLLKTASPPLVLKIPSKIKQLYHAAGTIREAQLEMETISDRQYALPGYVQKLQKTISDQENEWAAIYSKKTFWQFSEKLQHNNYDDLETVSLSDFFNLRFASINKIAGINAPSPRDLHQARKDVKDILYNTKTANQQWLASHAITKQIPIERLEKLASSIGDYHDKVTMLEHISAFSILLVLGEEKTLIEKIKEHETSRIEREKVVIVDTLKEFTTPLSC